MNLLINPSPINPTMNPSKNPSSINPVIPSCTLITACYDLNKYSTKCRTTEECLTLAVYGDFLFFSLIFIWQI